MNGLSQYIGPLITALIIFIGGAAAWGRIRNIVENSKNEISEIKLDIKDRVQKDNCVREMSRGDHQFSEIKSDIKDIKTVQASQDKVLIKIDTTLTLWAKNNHLPLSNKEVN